MTGWRDYTWRGIHLVAATALLVAATAKALSLSSPAHGYMPFPEWLAWAGVLFESALAFWLLSGLAPLYAWRGAMALFAALALVSMGIWVRGEVSCGCFGATRVHPGSVFVADIVFLIALAALGRPPLVVEGERQQRAENQWSAFGATLTAVLSAGMILGVLHSRHIVIVAEPKNWVGRPLPLRDFMVDGAQRNEIVQADSIVLLVDSDCASCTEYLEAIEQSDILSSHLVYLIDLSHLNDEKVDAGPFRRVRLTPNLRILATVPSQIWVAGGIVEFVEEPVEVGVESPEIRLVSGLSASGFSE